MFRRIVLILTSLVFCLALVCPTTTPPNSVLTPKQWQQLQADAPGTGFNAVHTSIAIPPLRKWIAQVGEMASCSPVVDRQGTIWVGTVTGDIVGINPNGTERKRYHVGGTIVSSPAVDDDGRVFVLVQYNSEGGGYHSVLQEYDPVVGLHPPVPVPNYQSTASPKIWGNYVFVPADRMLKVFDRWSLALVDEHVACPSLACGSFDPPLWYQAIRYIPVCIGTLYISDLLGLADCVGGFTAPNLGGGFPVEPSVAIVDNPAIVGDANQPIVVVATPQCLTASISDRMNRRSWSYAGKLN